MQTGSFALQGLLPAHSPHEAVIRSVALPYGGPTDEGGSYAAGLGLGMVGGTAQPEIWTITSTLSDGTWRFVFSGGDRTFKTPALAFDVTPAALKTALETYIFGTGSIASLTGTAATEYVITFAKNARIGGLISLPEAATGDISIARTQRGSVGAGQYDVYDGSGVTTIDALLRYETKLDPTGARETNVGTASGQPFSPDAYIEGFFTATDIPNIASGAVGNDKKLGYSVGSSVTAAGTILRLSQKN